MYKLSNRKNILISVWKEYFVINIIFSDAHLQSMSDIWLGSYNQVPYRPYTLFNSVLRPGKNRVLRVPQLVHVHCKYIDLYVYVLLKIKSKRRGKTRWFRCKAHTLAAICCEWSDWMDIFFFIFYCVIDICLYGVMKKICIFYVSNIDICIKQRHLILVIKLKSYRFI